MWKGTFAAIACACATAAAAPASAPAKPKLRVYVENDYANVRFNDHKGSPIFLAKERGEIARAVGAFLAHAGYAVVPADDVDRLVLAARTGKNLATGAACGEPVPPSSVFDHELPGVAGASAVVACTGKHGASCALTIDSDAVHYRATVPAHATVAQVIAAAKRLRTYPAPDETAGGFFGMLGGAGAGAHVVFDMDGSTGTWSGNPATVFSAHAAELDACVTDERRSNISNDLVLDIAPSGTVATCESDADDALLTPGFACLCKALGGVDFGAGTGVRRLRVDVHHMLPDIVRADRKRVSVAPLSLTSADPTVLWADTGVSMHAIGECLTGTESLPVKIPVQWHVDATGHPTLAIGAMPGASQATSQCLHKVLMRATFACPQGGKDVDVTGVYSAIEVN